LLVREGVEVHALVRQGSSLVRLADIAGDLRLVHADLCDATEVERQVARIAPELCLHAAWYAVPGEYLHADENVGLVAATASLVSVLARAGCRRFVGVGTCFEYDTRVGRMSESSPTRPGSMYAASKLAASLLAEQIGSKHGMAVAWARLFYQYGPYEDERRLVPAVVGALLRGQEAPVTSGRQVRDFLYVEDVAGALWAIARSAVGGPVNVGSGEPVSVRDLVERIAAIMGRRDLLAFGNFPDRPDDPPLVCANNRRLVEECGWRRNRTHDEGLLETVEWWRSRRSSPAAVR
jgi:nucleoside-diphosphate-sugar epimerase